MKNLDKDILGNKYGRLTIIKFCDPSISKDSKKSYKRVLCKCDCGNEKKIILSFIIRGSTKSCGCFRSEISRINGEAVGKKFGIKRRKYSMIESSARDLYKKYMKRNFGNLDFKLFYKLTQLPCIIVGTNRNKNI